MSDQRTCYQRIPVKRSDFGLNWKDPEVFARSQWPLPKLVYIAYRLIFMAYILTWDILNVVYGVDSIGAYYLIFLTNWSFHILDVYGIVAGLSTVYFSWHVFVVTDQRQFGQDEEGIANTAFVISGGNITAGASTADVKQQSQSDVSNGDLGTSRPEQADEMPLMTSTGKNPWYFKLLWLLFNINVVIAPLVSIVYWSLLHDFTSRDEDPLDNGMNFNVHAMNSILIITDLIFSAYPVRIVHCIYGVAYGLVYVVFSLIYWAGGGINPFNQEKAIYPILNWEEIPGLTVAYILGLGLVLIVTQCIVYGLFRLRLYVADRCLDTRKASPASIGSPSYTMS